MELGQRLTKRAIVEARYGTRLIHLDKRGEIYERWKHRFPRLQLPGTDIKMFNDALRVEAFVRHHHVGISYTDVTNQANFRDIGASFVDSIAEITQIESFHRVGARFIYMFPEVHLEEVREVFRAKVFALSESNYNRLGDELDELSFYIRVREGDCVYRYLFEILEYNPPDESDAWERERLKFYPGNTLVADVDAYKTGEIPAKANRRFILEAQQKSWERVDSFLRNL